MGAPLRIYAIFAKELIQMRRDRLTFAIMLVIPVMQLILFGYAINNDPRQLPTAVHLEERTPLTRTLLSGLAVSDYFHIVSEIADPRAGAERMWSSFCKSSQMMSVGRAGPLRRPRTRWPVPNASIVTPLFSRIACPRQGAPRPVARG